MHSHQKKSDRESSADMGVHPAKCRVELDDDFECAAPEHLVRAQSALLAGGAAEGVSGRLVGKEGARLWTVQLKASSSPAGREVPPIVLLHGYGAGLAYWWRQVDALVLVRPLILLDLPGHGRSDPMAFAGGSSTDAEDCFVEALEGWRDALGIARMTLVGHALVILAILFGSVVGLRANLAVLVLHFCREGLSCLPALCSS